MHTHVYIFSLFAHPIPPPALGLVRGLTHSRGNVLCWGGRQASVEDYIQPVLTRTKYRGSVQRRIGAGWYHPFFLRKMRFIKDFIANKVLYLGEVSETAWFAEGEEFRAELRTTSCTVLFITISSSYFQSWLAYSITSCILVEKMWEYMKTSTWNDSKIDSCWNMPTSHWVTQRELIELFGWLSHVNWTPRESAMAIRYQIDVYIGGEQNGYAR